MRFRTTLPAGALGLALVLAACSDSSSSPDATPITPAVADAQVQEMAAAVLDDADESLASVLDEIGGGMMGFSNTAPCPLITSSFTNDPAPSFTARVQFGTLPEATTPWPPAADDPCLRTGEAGWRDRDRHMGGSDLTMQVYLFGLLEKRVSGTRDADLERTETAIDLGWVRSVNDFTDFVRMQRNGTRSFSRTAAGLLASEDMVTARQRKLGVHDLESTITAALDWSFVPAEGSTLVSRESRPSGNISVTGSHRFAGEVPVRGETAGSISVAEVDVTHSVQTNAPLFYDSSCTQFPPRRRIASGQLQFIRTNGTASRSFTITWSGCGVEPVRAEVMAG
jgi:hypothetical protein